MTKFKKGDKVVVKSVKEPIGYHIKEKVGNIGIVEDVSFGWTPSDDEFACNVIFDDGTYYYFFEDELELVTDAR